jgi:hypothetical protein
MEDVRPSDVRTCRFSALAVLDRMASIVGVVMDCELDGQGSIPNKDFFIKILGNPELCYN